MGARHRAVRLPEGKRDQLDSRRSGNKGGSPSVTIPRSAVRGPCPLSFAQQRLWFLEQLEPGTPTYNIPVGFRLLGRLNDGALERSLNELIKRHESLRTTFAVVEGEPVQMIAPFQSFSLRREDLQQLAESEREDKALQLVTEEASQSFDLSQGPLLRVTLLRLTPQEHILLLVVHHIISDGWSMGVAYREVAAFYRAFSAGEPSSPLPELPIQYVDYSCWQRQFYQGNVLDEQISYWKKQLDGAPPVLELPTDHARPAVQSSRGQGQFICLPTALTEALRALGRQEGATLFMTILASVQVLLSRYTRRDDIVVGTPTANRMRTETEGLIGFFVNTLVFRTDLAGDPSFREFVRRVRAVSLEAFSYQDLPFEKLVEELRPDRDPSYNPLFQVMFTFQNAAQRFPQLQGVAVSPINIKTLGAKFDLDLTAVDRGDELLLRINYRTDLFESATITRMLAHWQTLLEAATANPEATISALPLLTEPERKQLLIDWNSAEKPYPRDKCIHDLFQAQAERSPETEAVVFEGGKLSYRELNQRANRLAERLRTLGVGPEVVVGLCTERSLEMVVGMLGILKAGGAYLPLDPSHPRERLHFMLEDAGARVLLVQEKLAESFSGETIPIIPLENAGQGFSDKQPPAGPEPGNLAYIMYTSGSTGKPKGVPIEHLNVVAFLHSYQPFQFNGERRIGTNVAPFCFDTSVEEIFGNLCFGGTVHIIRPEHSTDARYFARYLVEQGINFSYMVPDMIEPVARELADLRGRLKLQCLVTGLAPKKQYVLQAFRDLSDNLRILNAYGPTEVTYGATAFEFHTASEPNREVPIGKPFANYQVYVVDEKLQPVPIGVAGELLIGGVGLARGYLNQPELTAEKFIPDLFGNEPGARLYRSGDLVRYLPDGNIEFLGRVDSQVKIRGFRIEPGEIEASLARHEAVERAVVTVRESPAGDQRLAAYIVFKQAQHASAGELRSFLRDKLPDYMAPSAYSFLEALPLMVSGKVDMKALPEPDWNSLGREESILAPSNAMEAQLVQVWQKILGIAPIGIRDNFFDLGGHSMLAVSLFSEMEKVFGMHLSLATLFQAPTVEQLARVLSSAGLAGEAWSSLVPIETNGSNPPFFCAHANSGQVLFYRDLARHLGPEQPLYGLQSVGLDGRHEPLTRVEDMAAHYIEEMRKVQPHGPYLLGGFCMGAYIALEIAHQLQEQGQQVALVASINTDGAWKTVTSFREGIYYHLRNLSRLRWMRKLEYVAVRLRYRWSRVKSNITHAICGFHFALGRPLPPALRDLYILEVNGRASKKYVGRVFQGQLTYFQATGNQSLDPRLFWEDLATGGLEIHQIPGRYIDVMSEPNVGALAGKLQACINKAISR